jgi:3-deoxy-D-manno-octulosonate 8-phosphate phosphatase (KDO 8-P phosphatase)
LGIEEVHQGYFDKLEIYRKLKERTGLFDAEIAYIGDDLFDLGVMKKVGLSICPADAVPEVKEIADLVTQHNGGRGAVREIIELILKARGKWDILIDDFIQGKTAGNPSP